MRKISRSNTLVVQKIKIFSSISVNKNNDKKDNVFKSNINNNQFIVSNLIKNDDIDNNKDDTIPKKLSSDKTNLISVNYITEYKLLKKKKEHELELEIQNLAKILLSKNKIEEIKDENSLIYLLTQKTKRVSEENKEKLIEIIKYILLKQNKTDYDTLIIKTYFLKNEKLASLILPSNIINSDSLINKLSNQLKFEEYKKNSIICKEGDKGEKLYIVLKGKSGVVVQKEGKGGECTPFEYIKYLIVLYLYQEMSMVSRILYYNKQIMKIEERCVLTLLMVFRFYKYYKDHNFFLSESKKPYEEDNIYEFIINEKKLKDFIYQKYDYPVEDSIYIFDYSQKVIKELFEFYERKIEEINRIFEENQEYNYEEEKIPRKSSVFFKPGDFKELNIFSYYYESKIRRHKKLKNKEEIFNKVFSITEISNHIIYSGNVEDYIKRVDFNNIMREIQEDFIDYHDFSINLKEAKMPIRYFYYNEVNSIKEENMFGELALNNMNKKRTATIITKEDSYFVILSKKVYDSYLKVAQIKSRIRKMLYFTEGPIFKGLLHGTFLNKYFFRIKKLECSKGKILFNKDELRNKIYFIVKGEFELSCKMTLNEISETIKLLGGICENKKEKYLCNLYDDFSKYYISNKLNIKICVVNNNQIIGMDDMTINNRYIFDCKCISSDETDIYEFDYNKFEEALKENDLIMQNNINYVNKRRELYIKILFAQRNSLVDLEYKKIKEKNKKNKKLTEIDLNKKDNILSTLMKKVEYNHKDKEKAISILEKYRVNKKIKNSQEYNTMRSNSNESIIKYNNKSNNINNNSLSDSYRNDKNNQKYNFTSKKKLESIFKSEKNICQNNIMLLDNNISLEKTTNNFYPKRMSEKNIQINIKKSFGNIINKIKNSEKEEEIKKMDDKKSNKKIKLKLKEIYNNNKFLSDIHQYINTSNYYGMSLNSTSNIIKSFNINLSHSKAIEKTTKRSIIPILTNYKLNLKKKNKNINKNKLNYKFPSLFKEYSKNYIVTKTRVSNPDDFYLDYQEKIFNINNKKYNKNILLATFQKKYNEKMNKKDNESINDENIRIKNKSVSVNLISNKKRNKNNINYFNNNFANKNVGIIDCLFLDNWAEKIQFEKQYFK